MKVPQPVIIDFETDGIESRPAYPPEPVSVSIRWPGKRARYHAWGHKRGNNSTKRDATRELAEAYRHSDGVCFQHARFDTDVAEVHLGLKPPPWDKVHDTLFQLFLKDPDAGTLELKPAAERLLGRKPDERDAVRDWLLEHQPVSGVKISASRGSDHYFMKYLRWAPGDIVGPYACADVDSAGGLFPMLHREIAERGMLPAYDRERRLSPHLLATERRGLRVDLRRLERDVKVYDAQLVRVDAWLRKRLRIGDSVNLDSDKELLPILLSGGHIDPKRMKLTKKTQEISLAKGSLQAGVEDPQLGAAFVYRAGLTSSLRGYLYRWREQARRTDGLIHTLHNQTRNAEGSSTKGTRTGRMSCTWFMNMPKAYAPIFAHETEGGLDPRDPDRKRKLPKHPFHEHPVELPLCRGYVIPYEKDHVLIDRDYVQQEPHILAHFENGKLLSQYLQDPWLDVHDNASKYIQEVFHIIVPRRNTKIINLGIIYGKGVPNMAKEMGVDEVTCRKLHKLILGLYPDLEGMNRTMKQMAAANEPLVTWGGREYFCEPPRIVEGKGIVHWEYKMVNRLVQGSAADCTKEAVIRYCEAAPRDHHFLVQVHDQLVASVPKRDLKRGMELMRRCMESVEFDLAMVSEGEYGKSWGTLRHYDVGPVKWRELKSEKRRGVILREDTGPLHS